MISLSNLQKSFINHGTRNITDLMGNIIGQRHDITVAQGSEFEKRFVGIGYKKLITLDFLDIPVVRYFRISYNDKLPDRTIAGGDEPMGVGERAADRSGFIIGEVHHAN